VYLPNFTTLTTNVGWSGHPIDWQFATIATGLSNQPPPTSSFVTPPLLLPFQLWTIEKL
jgi:hypothetical protein